VALNEALLLDTHVWIWLANGLLRTDLALESRLRSAAEKRLLFIASITLLEVANADQRGRLQRTRSLDDWFAVNLASPGVRLIEITPSIAAATAKLPAGFHGDPGDRLIAATASTESLTLVTHDKALLRFGRQGLYPVLKASQRKMVR
jgi:PIN domain nuclease of toxin-antitoxin system